MLVQQRALPCCCARSRGWLRRAQTRRWSSAPRAAHLQASCRSSRSKCGCWSRPPRHAERNRPAICRRGKHPGCRPKYWGRVLRTAGSTRRSSLPVQPVAHIDGKLLFAGQALSEEVAVAALQGSAGRGDIFQLVQIVNRLRPDARLLQVAAGVGILGIDKGPGLWAFCVFKPAIVVDNLCPEIIVCHGIGIRQRAAAAAMIPSRP